MTEHTLQVVVATIAVPFGGFPRKATYHRFILDGKLLDITFHLWSEARPFVWGMLQIWPDMEVQIPKYRSLDLPKTFWSPKITYKVPDDSKSNPGSVDSNS